MGKRDPFVKDNDGGSPLNEEVIDFGETKVVSVDGGSGNASGDGKKSNRTKIIAGILVIGTLLAVGGFFLFTQQDEPGVVVSDDAKKSAPKAKMDKAKTPTAMDANSKADPKAHKADMTAATPAGSAAKTTMPTPGKPDTMGAKADAPTVPASAMNDKMAAGPAKVLPSTTATAKPTTTPTATTAAVPTVPTATPTSSAPKVTAIATVPTATTAAPKEVAKTESKPKTQPQAHTVTKETAAVQTLGAEDADEGEMAATVSGASAPALLTPEDGATRNYDETANMAAFTWSGGAGWITFSSSPKMHPVDIKALAKSGHFELPRPHPGIWYWQVSNSKGKSAVRMFTINPPLKRSISLLNVQDGASLSKDNAVVSWKGDNMVTYYRVEVSNKGWANPSYRFATTGTQLEMRGVPQGQYQIRLGAFSEISGRWEYTDPLKVTVQ